MTDRVKQIVFDTVQTRIAGRRVLDVFAGTGSFGLEALSRDAEHCTFYERDPATADRLRRNLETVGEPGEIVTGDLFKLPTLPPFRLAFLDPPYRFLNDRADLLRSLAEKLHAAAGDDALLVFRHDAKDALTLPGWEGEARTYGGMTVEYLSIQEATP